MKFNKNIIVFVAVMLFILVGFTKQYYDDLKYELISFAVKNADAAEDLPTLLDNIDEISTDKLRYHNELMNMDSLKQRLTGKRIIIKDTTTVVRTECDSLMEPQTKKYAKEEVMYAIDAVTKLRMHAQKNGAEFLYIAAPVKPLAMDAPEWVADYSRENLDLLISGLAKNNVPTLNLCQVLEEEGRLDSSLFFKTDHHWKPEVGFWAAGEICRELNNCCGFEYNTGYTDIANYNVRVYRDTFLGSYGKKVGLHYVAGGAEDISLITPKFDTNLTESRPYANIERTGSFQETVLFMENIEEIDYFEKNPYATYSGGDFRLQIIENNVNPGGKKILLVRDSFACVVTPFLALNAGELHVVDVRGFIPSEALSVNQYIEEVRPDYVLVLYSGGGAPGDISDRYEFNPS